MSEAPDSDPQCVLDEAIACHQRGAFDEARRGYQKLLELSPAHAGALHLCGITYFQEGNFGEAEGYIRSAIALEPDNCDYYSNLGLVLKAANRIDDAIAALDTALAVERDNADALNNLGSTLVAAGRTEQAVRTFRRLLELEPDHPEACNNLAVVIGKDSCDPEAEALFRRALARQPQYLDARMNYGRMLHRCERRDEAVAQFRAALEIDPGQVTAYRELADSLVASGRFDEALLTCRQALEIDPDNADSLVSLGSALQHSGQADEAERCYRAALERDPDNARAYNNLGTLALADNDLDAAMHFFVVAGNKDPSFVEAMFNKGTALQKQGRLAEAAGQFSMVIARNPRIPNAFRYLSEIYRVTGMRDSQVRVLRHWLEHFPGSPTATHLLRAADGTDQPSRAPDDFVREEFDGFADSFDATLASLDYATPQMLANILARNLEPNADLEVLDAGCGTGLCGRHLRPYAARLTGVDLSAGMLARAERTGCYDELIEAELTGLLASASGAYDLVVSADTLVYFGELDEVFAAASAALADGGRLLFSVEEADADIEHRLNASGRYAHGEAYLRQALAAAGLEIVVLDRGALRNEAQKAVAGLLVMARRAPAGRPGV